MKKIMHFFFLSCLKATELIEKKLHISLTIKEKIQLKMHKSMCNACRQYGKQSTFIDKALKKYKFERPVIDLEEFKRNIKKKLFDL